MRISFLLNKKVLAGVLAIALLLISGSAVAFYMAVKSGTPPIVEDSKDTSGIAKQTLGGQVDGGKNDSDSKDTTSVDTDKKSSSKSTAKSNAGSSSPSSSSSGNSSSGGTSGGVVCPVASLHMPDGPDGNGGCWPGPLTTGPAVAPTRVYPLYTSGDRYVFDGGEVVDGYIVNGSILVRGNNVVIKNSIVNGAIEVYDTGSLTVMDSEVHGGDWIGYTLTGANYTVLRSDTDGAGAVSICDGNCSFVDTYSHDPHYFDDWDAHQSAYATVGNNKGPLELRHSTVWCNNPVSPLGGGCTGDIALQNTFYPVVDTTIDNNLFMPSASGSYCGTFGWNNSSNIVVTNNVFRRGSNGKCGVYGTIDAFRTDGPGNVWSGNVYDDGSVALPNV